MVRTDWHAPEGEKRLPAILNRYASIRKFTNMKDEEVKGD